MRPGLLVALMALTACGCGASRSPIVTSPSPSANRPSRMVVVPDLVGVPRSRASCVLEQAGLRWRSRGDRATFRHAQPSCEEQRAGGVAVSPDPRVLRQSPRAGQPVPWGAVIVIDDACTAVRSTRQRCA